MSLRIVVLDGYTVNPGDLNWDPINMLGNLIIYDRTEPHQIIERSIDADILVVNKVRLSDGEIDQLKRLQCICLLATGFDNVDIHAAAKHGIAVCNAVGYGTESVAQHTLSLMLAWTNHVTDYSGSVRNGVWEESPDFTYQVKPVFELKGKNLGLFGLGKIGSRVASLASVFGMQVLAYVRDSNKKVSKTVRFVSAQELFESSDFLSLHVPLDESTRNLIDRKVLNMMKPHSILINTARGGLVVEEDLYDALKSGNIRGAALDVISIEPPAKRNPLMNLENCIITPHMAWTSVEARKNLIQIVADNIKTFIKGNPANRVN